MGRSVDLNKLNIENAYRDFIKETKIEDTKENKELFIYVLKLHGIILGDFCLILNNEFYEDYNLFYMVSKHMLKAFGFIELENFEDHSEYEDNIPEIFSTVILKNREIVLTDIEVDDEYSVVEKIKEYKEK